MKKKLIIGLVLLLALMVMVIVAYRIGHEAGRQQTLGLSRGTFALTLSALQSLHTNNVGAAVQVLDGQCYAHAVFLLESPRWRDDVCMKTFIPELIEYRRKLAGDPALWTPTEIRLEKLLAKQGWKSEQSAAPLPSAPAGPSEGAR